MTPALATSSRRRGLTLVELVMGLSITMLIAGAVAAFALAISTGWRSSQTGQAIAVSAAQATLRMQAQLQGSIALGACVPGSPDGSATAKASLLFWKNDYNGDGLIQTSELALIVHEGDALTLYECDPTQRATLDAADPYTAGQLTTVNAGAWFRALPHLTHQTLTGTASVAGLASASHLRVVGVKFTEYTLFGQRPIVEYTVSLVRNGNSALEYGMVAVRSAFTAVNQ